MDMSNKRILRTLISENGQTTTEYYLIIAILIIAMVAAFSTVIGPTGVLNSAFQDTATFYNTFISRGPWH